MGGSMNSKRSDLDTLNADRQRKPSTTLEQITQSLQNLESRLDRSRDALDEVGRDREPRNQRIAPFRCFSAACSQD